METRHDGENYIACGMWEMREFGAAATLDSILRAPKAIANVASRRISEKNGMRVIRAEEPDHVGGRFPAEIWEIIRDEWNARQPRQ